MQRCTAWLLAVSLSTSLGSAPSRAADNSLVEPGKAEPAPFGQKAPTTTGPIITDTTIPQAPGTASLEIKSFLAFRVDNFNSAWRRENACGNFFSPALPAQFTYGLAPRTEIFAVVQYVHNWAADVTQPGGGKSSDFGGLGDTNLTLKYLLLDEKPTSPAVAGIFSVTFPTGHHRRLNPARLGTDQLGAGFYIFTGGFDFFKFAPPVLLYANLYYHLTTDATVGGARLHPRDFVTVNLAAEYPLTRRWVLLLELVSTWDAGRLIGPQADQSPSARVSLLPGLEFIASKKWQGTGGVLIDLVGKNTAANVTPVLAFFYNF